MLKEIKALTLAATLVACSGAAPPTSKKHHTREENTGRITAVLWSNPADIASRDLFYGPGGSKHQPRGPFTFVKENLEQHNPKFVVRDAAGVKWTVKLGFEARPETAASRLVWGVGYFADEDYFLSELRVEGMPARLKRGQEFVGGDGTIRNVRMERDGRGMEKVGTWQWRHNPFERTRELNGLRVLMALINNWDLKDENNAIREARHGKVVRVYMISDLGSSFGTTGCDPDERHAKGNDTAYRRSRFISKVTAAYVDFGAPSRPSLLLLVDLPYFISSLRMRWIGRHVPREHARWMGELLGRLSPQQVRDVFRAAGYAPQQIDTFAGTVQRRIAALNEL